MMHKWTSLLFMNSLNEKKLCVSLWKNHYCLFFLFVGIHLSVDIYAIFRFEAMHYLSLGFDEMFKDCIVLMLGDDSKLTSDVRYASKYEAFQVYHSNCSPNS